MADRWRNDLDSHVAGRVIREPLPARERERIEREIAATMADVVSDAWHRTSPVSYPGGFGPPPKRDEVAVPAAPEPRGTGWREAPPLDVPGGATTQALIEQMVNAFQPHQPGNPEYRGAAAQSRLAKAVAAARATPKAPAPEASAAPEPSPAAPEAVPVVVVEPVVVAASGGATVTRRRLI